MDLDVKIESIYTVYKTSKYNNWRREFRNEEYYENSTAYSLVYLSSGEVRSILNRENSVVRTAGSVLLADENTNYINESVKLPTAFTVIRFFTAKPLKFVSDNMQPVIYMPENHERVSAMFEEVYNLFENGSFKNRFRIKILILEILNEVYSGAVSNRGTYPTTLFNALNYIDKMAFEENINIRKLAEDSNLNYEYFIRLFKKNMGVSPKRYINGLRLKRAEILLRKTEYPIKRTGSESGFFDSAYFNETFKECFHLTPYQYRKEHSGSEKDTIDYSLSDIEYIYSIYKNARHSEWKRHFVYPEREDGLYRMMMCVKGEISVIKNNQKIRIQPGTTLFITPESDCVVKSEALPGEYITISFFTFQPIEIPEKNVVVFKPENPEYYIELFEKSYSLYDSSSFQNRTEIKITVLKILNGIFEEYVNLESRYPSCLHNALNYIDKMAFEENINIRKLAEDSNLSYEYFIRLFKKHLGCSPKKYINSLRVERAEMMLRKTELDVRKVALDSGYFDIGYFVECFKESYGISPFKYRAHVKEEMQ